jgi:hypothetical protein
MMKQMMNEYIQRVQPHAAPIGKHAGHLIVSSLLTFKFGVYGTAIERSTEALRLLSERAGIPGAVKTALLILKERARDLEETRPTVNPENQFTDEHRELLAINLPPDRIEDQVELDLDNALLLLYAVGLITSPDDEDALLEHSRFAIQILESYKEKLGA